MGSISEDQEDSFTVNERSGNMFTQEMCLYSHETFQFQVEQAVNILKL